MKINKTIDQVEKSNTLQLSDLPADVIDTWNDWKNNFDESTTQKKIETSKRLRKHFDACESAGLDREQVAILLFKVK